MKFSFKTCVAMKFVDDDDDDDLRFTPTTDLVIEALLLQGLVCGTVCR